MKSQQPASALRGALAAIQARITAHVASDSDLPRHLLRTAPLHGLMEALRTNDLCEMIDIGRVAADWLSEARSREQRPGVGAIPDPAITAYEQAARTLIARAPACAIVEAEHESCRFDADVTHTVIGLDDVNESAFTVAHALSPPQAGRWYIAELVREDGPHFCEVIEIRLVAGPFESELTARFQQLYLAPLSVRPGPADPTLLPPVPGGLGAWAAPGVSDWARDWSDQHFPPGTEAARDAVNGYLAAMWGDGTHQDGRGSEEWGRGWIAGCAARLLGYRGLPLAVQQQDHAPYPDVPPLWMVVNLFTGEAVPTLTNLVGARDAARLARGYGVLENEPALPL